MWLGRRRSGSSSVGRPVRGVFSLLKNTSKSLFVVLLIGLLESVSYCILSLVYTLLLSGGFGVSDFGAGLSFGLWGLATALFSVALSPLIELLGVKKSLFFGLALSTGGRAWLAFGHSKLHLWINVYVILPIGSALTNTAVFVGIKRHSSASARAFTHSLHCGLSNVAMLASGLLFDFVGVWVKDSSSFWGERLSSVGTPLNDASRLCLLVGGMASASALPLALLLTEGARTNGALDQIALLECGDLGEKLIVGGAETQHHKREGSANAKPKWLPVLQYLMVCIVSMNLNQMFQQLNASFPKYHIRAFGCDSLVGSMYSVYPLVRIFLGPIVQWSTSAWNYYSVIHYGSYIAGLSPFVLAFFQTQWASIFFVGCLALGEAMLLPRWYDFSLSIVPGSNEVISTALAAAPQFLAKLSAGVLSGFLMSGWCPNSGECTGEPIAMDRLYGCQGKYIWGLIGMLGLMTPIGLSIGAVWLKIPAILQKAKNIL